MSMISKRTLAAGAVLAGLLSNAAGAADAYRDGWVSQVAAQQVQVCYPHGPAPLPPQAVQVLRPQFVVLGKGLRQTYLPVGRARIEAPAEASCAKAALLEGEARRGDHVRAG